MKTESFYFQIADFNIRFSFHESKLEFQKKKILNEILQTYQGFRVGKKPTTIDFELEFKDRLKYDALYDPKNKLNYFSVAEGNYRQSQKMVVFYQISIYQLELLIRNIIVELLRTTPSFMLHTSAVNTKHGTVLFSGPPGAGKSTAMKLLSSKFKALADDSVIIKRINNNYFLFQTPITEKEDWIVKGSDKYKIRRICYPIKSTEFKFEKIQSKEIALQKLIEEFWTRNEQYAKQQLKHLFEFASNFDEFYFIHFAKDADKLISLISSSL